MKAYPPGKRPAAASKTAPAADYNVGNIGTAESIQLAIYLPDRKLLHRFTATAVGSSYNAIKFVSEHGPRGASREEFFWLPKSFKLKAVPRCTKLWFMPIVKAREIGISKILSFNHKS